jgi:hypothetical protein
MAEVGSVSIGNLRLKVFRNVLLQTREIKSLRDIMKRQRQQSIRGGISVIGHYAISRTKSAVVQPLAQRFIAEWQQRGPETLSGRALRKLRLTFAPTQSATT